MKIESTIAGEMTFTYEESFWTGKKTITVNDVPLTKINRRQFMYNETLNVTVQGTFITGIKLLFSDGRIIEVCKNVWYDWILIFLPLLNIFFGVAFGAIGGGLTAFFSVLGSYLNAIITRSKVHVAIRVLVSILITVFVFFIWVMLYALIAGGFDSAFPTIFG